MAWQTTGDVAEFLAAAGPYLRRERVRNTVILTVTETMRVNAAAAARESPAAAGARPLLGWCPADGRPGVAGRCSAGGLTRPAPWPGRSCTPRRSRSCSPPSPPRPPPSWRR